MFCGLLAARDTVQLLSLPLGHDPVISVPGCLPSRVGIFPPEKEINRWHFSLRTPFSNQHYFHISWCIISGFWIWLCVYVCMYGYKSIWISNASVYFCVILSRVQVPGIDATSFHLHSLLYAPTQGVSVRGAEVFKKLATQDPLASEWQREVLCGICSAALYFGGVRRHTVYKCGL